MKNYYDQFLKMVERLVTSFKNQTRSCLPNHASTPHLTMFTLVGLVVWWYASPKFITGEVSSASMEVGQIVAEQVAGQSPSFMDCHECYATINLSLNPDCERLITADLLLKNNALAISNPEYFDVRLTVGNGLIIADNTLKIQYVGKNISAMVSYVGPPPCPQGLVCMTMITLKSATAVQIEGTSPLTVYCHDPFLKEDPTSSSYPYKPVITQTCEGVGDGPYFAGDWVKIHDCVLGIQDTAKTIYRQWSAISKDGTRSMAIDTIYVLRLPPLSASNLFCASKDTLFCGISDTPIGPYLIVPDPVMVNECDTIYLMDRNLQAATIDPKCGLSIRIDSIVYENTGCTKLRKYIIQVHQNCYGTANQSVCQLAQGLSDVNIEGGGGLPIYASCEFWLLDIDTMAPYISCNFESSIFIDTCSDGFALSHGYWKTHSIFGPAPYDDTWALLPVGENTPFFLSGQTYYNVINAVPAGNAYYILAFQYIAARLNFLNNSDPTAVQAVFDQATMLFLQYTPAQIDALMGNSPLRSEFIMLAMILDDYNNGVIGPGFCGEGLQLPAKVVAAGPDCVADFVLPKVMAIDICNEVLIVKAMVETFGVVSYVYDSITGYWVSETQVRLPVRSTPYKVYYEAFDECFNVGKDTCAILVVDRTNPTAVAHSGLTLELPDKIAWMDVSQINNNSSDNCEVNLVLARRVDWATHWPDFCDSTRFYDKTGPELDTVWCKYVEPNLAVSEFEAYYAQVIEDFGAMMNPCGLLMYQSWIYDLCRYATLECKGAMTETAFRELYSKIHPETDVNLVAQIGGGWAGKVPFTCADACDSVTVELLVMDYWCNWSTTWTKVLVEDKTPATVEVEITDSVNISCIAYLGDSLYHLTGSMQPLPLADIFEAAAGGNIEAQGILDSVLGGYEKAWVNEQHQFVDSEGQLLQPQITFTDGGICVCTPATVPVRYYDLETRSYLTKDSSILVCETLEEAQIIQKGIIAVNCGDNTYCAQTIEFDLDQCGLGTISRRFKIWKTCGNEIPDTIERVQVITLEQSCQLNKYMFDLPKDTIINSCAPVFDPLGSGNVIGDVHPDRTGSPEYVFEADCRIIATAHDDKVLTLLLATGQCYAVIRTWYIADWCIIGNQGPLWWQDKNIVVDSFTQIIILNDTTPPACSIEVDNQIMDTIYSGNCGSTLTLRFLTFDTCGVRRYDYTFDTLSNPPQIKAFGGTILPGKVRDTMEVEILNVHNGHYRFIVYLEDHCGNRSTCVDSFVVSCDVSRQSGMIDQTLELKGKSQLSQNYKNGLSDDIVVPGDLRLSNLESQPFELHQNRPNPFRYNTVIGFHLPEATSAKLTVFDIQGRQLKVIEGQYTKGYQEIEISAEDLNTTGVLYYQLETEDHTATRRMILTP